MRRVRPQTPSPAWLRAAVLVLYAAGAPIFFYGLVIFHAALTTARRRLRSPDAPAFSTLAEELTYYENVARQGIVYGLSIAAVGFGLMIIGDLIRRVRHRQLVLKARQQDVEAFKNRSASKS